MNGNYIFSGRKSLWIIFIFLMPLLLSACGGSDDDGSECARCDSDEDCDEGLTRELFGNSQILFTACAKESTETCD